MPKLQIDDVIKLIVNLSKRSTVRSAFNLALLVGDSDTLKTKKETRLVVYTGADGLLEDGFSKESPEYLGAAHFFQQKPRPQRLAVCYWDKAGEEDVIDALKAARDMSTEWYTVMFATELDEAEALSVAAWCEDTKPATTYACGTSSVELAEKLFGLERGHTLVTVSKEKPVMVAIGIVGVAMGLQTGLADSAYTLFGKKIIGVTPDDYDNDTVKRLQKIYANYYVGRGAAYTLYEQGVMADGTWFDERINLDKLANDIQLAVMDLYTTVRKVPPDNSGVEMMRGAIKPACEQARKIGFIGPGTWTEDDVLDLKTGDMLPQGFIILNESVEEQADLDRENRLMVPFYVCIKQKGATHSATIQVEVNR